MQGCGSAFISSGSGSSILSRIPIRIRIQSGSRALMTKNWRRKITAGKKIKFFLKIYLSLGLHKERPSYRRSLQLSKEVIQDFKTWTLKKFFFFCGSFLPSWIRIRIPNPDPLTRLNPDLQPWLYLYPLCSGPGCGGRPAEQAGQHGGTEQRIHSVPPRTRQEKVSQTNTYRLFRIIKIFLAGRRWLPDITSLAQCCGSRSVGFICFWASRIRIWILLSLCKNNKKLRKTLIFTVLWPLYDFIFEK